MQEEYDLLGQVIKEARIAAALTREQLDGKINKSPRYIASIENEHKRPSYKSLCEIIVALNINSNLIFYPNLLSKRTSEKDRVYRMIDKCNDYEIGIISATLDANLNT